MGSKESLARGSEAPVVELELFIDMAPFQQSERRPSAEDMCHSHGVSWGGIRKEAKDTEQGEK